MEICLLARSRRKQGFESPRERQEFQGLMVFWGLVPHSGPTYVQFFGAGRAVLSAIPLCRSLSGVSHNWVQSPYQASQKLSRFLHFQREHSGTGRGTCGWCASRSAEAQYARTLYRASPTWLTSKRSLAFLELCHLAVTAAGSSLAALRPDEACRLQSAV
jgi:hypothetical protein